MSVRASQAATRRPIPLRRRASNLVLRWQARLDAAWADRFIPWMVAACLFVVYTALALARAHTLDAGSALGGHLQAAWLITEGRAAEVTVTGNHLLADNLPVAFYPVAWLTEWVRAQPLLLGLQSAAIAVGVVPIWRIARSVVHLRVGAAAALVVAYGVHPSVNSLNLSDFHPEAMAVAPLLAATAAALQHRWRHYACFSLLAVAWNADVGLVIAGLGILLVLEGRTRVGLLSVALGGGWTALAVLVLEPRWGMAGLVTPGAFTDYGDSALDVLIAMVQNPIRVLGDVVAEPNLAVIVGLLAPVLFLPVLAPRYLVPALPLQLLYLVADVPITGAQGAEHTVPGVVFCFVAAAFALTGLGRRSVERVLVDRRVLIGVVVASLSFWAVDGGSSPYRAPWRWRHTDEIDEARHAAARLVGERGSVRASGSLLPLLAERVEVRSLERTAHDADAAGERVDAVILDSHWARWSTEDVRAFSDGLEQDGFDLVYQIRGISVFERVGAG
ncbi:MAG: DUF2079 domain-containing protein [Acidimicrobiales bacterium]